MKKLFLFIYIDLFFVIIIYSQNISEIKRVQVDCITSKEELDFSQKLNSKTNFLVPLNYFYGEVNDIVNFLEIDSTFNVNLLKLKTPKQSKLNPFCIVGGLLYPNNEFLLHSGKYLYFGYKKGNLLKLKKRKKINNYFKGDFYTEIYFLSYPQKEKILLAETYDSSKENQLYAQIKLALYNLKKGNYEKKISIDIGKAILLSPFSHKWIATSENIIAVASSCSQEILLLNNELNFVDTIKINYPCLNKTKQLVDSLFTDNILTKYKYDVKAKIDYLLKNDFFNYPVIDRIEFINNDLLYIQVRAENLEKKKEKFNYIHFVYSISNKEFYEENGNSGSWLSGSFINNTTVTIIDSVDNNDIYNYYVIARKIEIPNFSNNNELLLDTLKLPLKTDLEYYKPTDSIKNYSEFEYIMFSDIMACSHCRYDEKYKNILIIHCFSANEATDKTTKYRLLQMYQKMFVSPKVVFIKENNLKNKFVKHKIFKIKND